MRRVLLLFLLFAAAIVHASAQQTGPAADQPTVSETKPYLTADQIAVAIDRGLSNKQHNAGIHVVDTDSAIQSGMSCNNCGGTIYTVNAFTPAQWIESRAMLYKQHDRPFTADSVTPAMRSPAFRVFAYQVRRATGKMALPDPIKDVQLVDLKQKEVLKPLKQKESDARGGRNEASGSTSGSTEATVFDMAEVDKLSKNGTADIYVEISTQGGHSKFIKIKAQDLKE
jgi:hypothetical protein